MFAVVGAVSCWLPLAAFEPFQALSPALLVATQVAEGSDEVQVRVNVPPGETGFGLAVSVTTGVLRPGPPLELDELLPEDELLLEDAPLDDDAPLLEVVPLLEEEAPLDEAPEDDAPDDEAPLLLAPLDEEAPLLVPEEPPLLPVSPGPPLAEHPAKASPAMNSSVKALRDDNLMLLSMTDFPVA